MRPPQRFEDERFQTLAVKIDTYQRILKINKNTRKQIYIIIDEAIDAYEEKHGQVTDSSDKGKG